MRSASAILFPALLAASALGHAVLVHTRILPAKPAELDLPPAETTEIFLIEEPPPPDPVPTPEPTPEPLPPEPEPTPIPEEIVTAEQSPEVAELPPEPSPTPTPLPSPTPKPKPRPVPQTPKPQPAAIVSRSIPVVIQNTPPHYPDLARRKGWEGRAIIRVEVSAEGRPISASIAKSSGYGVLDQAALRAVKSWRFQPRAISGIPAAGTVEVPVNFSLNR